MLIPGRVVPGRILVLERPPTCTVLGSRGFVNDPLSDAPCHALHTHAGPRVLLGPFACLADVHQGTIACDRHLTCEVRAGALLSLRARPCCIVRGPTSWHPTARLITALLPRTSSVAKSEHDRRDGTGRRRPRRNRGGGVAPPSPRPADAPSSPSSSIVFWECSFGASSGASSGKKEKRRKKWKKEEKNKKNPRTPTSVFISVIRYASRSEIRGAHWPISLDHELPSPNPTLQTSAFPIKLVSGTSAASLSESSCLLHESSTNIIVIMDLRSPVESAHDSASRVGVRERLDLASAPASRRRTRFSLC